MKMDRPNPIRMRQLRLIVTLLLLGTINSCFPAPAGTETAQPTLTSIQPPATETPVTAFQVPPTSTAAPCQPGSGVVERVMVDSAALGTGLYALIYTPACYDPTQEYPVLYLLHGQGMTDKFWFDMGVTRIADAAIQKGQTPFLIVMPYEERNFDPIEESKFPEALITDLIPWVDANYATCTERSCRAIGGISRGGGWAVKLTVRNFEVFGTLGGHSIGLMAGDAWWVQKQLETHTPSEFPRIYLDRGDEDYLKVGTDYFENVLTASKIPHEFHIYPGAHAESYWKKHIEEYMRFYMAAWD